jgi:hypothetical protein
LLDNQQVVSALIQAGFGGVLLFVLGVGIPWLIREKNETHKETRLTYERLTDRYMEDRAEDRKERSLQNEALEAMLRENKEHLNRGFMELERVVVKENGATRTDIRNAIAGRVPLPQTGAQ